MFYSWKLGVLLFHIPLLRKKERENKEKSLLEDIDKLESEENINLHAVEAKGYY